MTEYKKPQTEADAQRGIQNTTTRFKETIKKRLLSEQIKNAETRSKQDNQTAEEEAILYDHIAQEEEYEAMQTDALLQSASIRAQTRNTAEALKSTNNLPKKIFPGGSLLILVWIIFFQFFFALCSGFFFATYAFTTGFIEGTTVGSVAGFFNSLITSLVGVDLINIVSGLWFAMAFWALILLITFLVLILIIPLFVLQKIPAFDGMGAILFLSVSFACNLVPFLNIIPWIEIWAGYWLLSGSIETIKGLSKPSTHND